MSSSSASSTSSSSRMLFVANSIVTIAFGIVALWDPDWTAQQLGFQKNSYDVGHLILLRGYASACLGYGIIMLRLSNISNAKEGLLLASAAFNLAEIIVQGHHFIGTTTTTENNNKKNQDHPNIQLDVLPTLIYHGLLFLWTIVLLLQTKEKLAATSSKAKKK